MSRRQGFTLLELLFIVATIAILAGIAVPNFLEAQTRSKIVRTKSDMAVIDAALRAYYTDFHAYPPNNPERTRFLRQCVDLNIVSETTLPTPPDATVPWTGGASAARKRPSPGSNTEFESMMGMYNFDPAVMGGMGYVGADMDATSSTLSAASGAPHLKTWENMGYYGIMDFSGEDLFPLTTPVAYYTNQLPRDTFSDLFNERDNVSFFYVNCDALFEMLKEEDKTPPVDPPIASERYILLSGGPADCLSVRNILLSNPVKGPITPYDPTNGTVSPGYFFSLGK